MRKFIKRHLNEIWKSQRKKQVIILYLSLVCSLVLGVAVSVVNTRYLGPDSYGDYKFLQVIWTTGVLLITFGVFTTGGNVLSVIDKRIEKEVIGSLVSYSVIVGLVYSVALMAILPIVKDLFGDTISTSLGLFWWVVIILPVMACLKDILRGTNDIFNLAILNVLPHSIYLVMALLANNINTFDLSIAVNLYFISILIASLIVVIRVKPVLNNNIKHILNVLAKNKSIGIHIYIAVLITALSTQFPQFILAHSFTTRMVGEFALAITITTPLMFIPNTFSTVFFKEFANMNYIKHRVIAFAFIVSFASIIIYLLLIDRVIIFLYTEIYASIVLITYICSIGAICRGLGDVFNKFLLSHGETRILRINAQYLSVISLVLYLFLILKYEVTGAAIAKLTLDMVFLISMIYYYRKYVGKNVNINN